MHGPAFDVENRVFPPDEPHVMTGLRLLLACAVQRYKHMIEVNKKYGSFYLESKVYRAWESLDQHYTEEGKKTPEEEEAVRKLLHQEAEAAQQQQQQEPEQQQRQ
jgi:import inner membrane translocase subunit TIM16